MKRIFLVCLALVFTAGLAASLWEPVFSASSSELQPVLLSDALYQSQREGWQVCAIREIGPIPGVGNRQKVEVCSSEGWRLMTYCINPGAPVPKLGAFCSQTSTGRFWCGAGVQELQQLAILETPAPRSTPTKVPTRTATAIRKTTLTALPQIEESATNTPFPSATAYYRPRAGGPGNLEVAAAGLAVLGLVIAGGWGIFRWLARPAQGR